MFWPSERDWIPVPRRCMFFPSESDWYGTRTQTRIILQYKSSQVLMIEFWRAIRIWLDWSTRIYLDLCCKIIRVGLLCSGHSPFFYEISHIVVPSVWCEQSMWTNVAVMWTVGSPVSVRKLEQPWNAFFEESWQTLPRHILILIYMQYLCSSRRLKKSISWLF